MMINLQNVSFNFNEQVHVLNQANYEFHNGAFYAFSGSTEVARNAIISLMSGLIEPDVGRVIFNGVNIKQSATEELLRKYIWLINLQNKYVEHLNVTQNIELVMDISVPEKKNKKEMIYDCLIDLGLGEEFFNKKIVYLNTFQRFLIDIAIITLCNKKVIFMIDPNKSFDQSERVEIVRHLKKLSHDMGKCVILSTDSKEVAKLANKIVVLKNGKLI